MKHVKWQETSSLVVLSQNVKFFNRTVQDWQMQAALKHQTRMPLVSSFTVASSPLCTSSLRSPQPVVDVQ